MHCPRCETINRDDRHFCSACGALLVVVCSSCGHLNEPGAGFCGGCGNALSVIKVTSHSERRFFPGTERRQLTVMFCDLVGSTALAHQLDPEDFRDILKTYHERARHVIERYGGYVARYVGDGMLVYFGYPHAQEDASVRAIHSGLEIAESVGRPVTSPVIRLSVRVGIATGLVVVGDVIGEGASAEAAAVGDAPNLASRLQELAEPNAVVIAQSTRDLAGGAFRYAEHGSHTVHGFAESVRAWRVLRVSQAASRFAASRSERTTRFVGREREIETLLAAWTSAKEGRGRIVLLTGEAGIGKSRVAEALGERIADEKHGFVCYQCSPHHANTALHPFIHDLEREAGLDHEDDADRKIEKLEALLASAGIAVDDTAPLLAALLSLPTDGRYPASQLTSQQLKQETLLALLHHLTRLTERGPVLVLVEDAHWIDPTSIELLGLLAQRVPQLPILVLVTSRSDPDYPWRELDHVTTLKIERLNRHDSATMAKSLLGDDAPRQGLIEHVVAKGDGVPLFIEELTKTLAAVDWRSGDRIADHPIRPPFSIPSTLQDSLMARLDRLGRAREVAQTAAAIGREFPFDLLAAVSALPEVELREALAQLTAGEIVFGQGEQPWTGYVFKHALVQDVAYSSLLRSKRQALHRQIGETLEQRYAERVRVEPEVVAHHFTEGGDALRAAKYWAAAAQRALDRAAFLEAAGHAQKGLELAGRTEGPGSDELKLALEVRCGAAYRAVRGFASSDSEASFKRARDLCTRLGDKARLVDVCRGLFACYYARGALALAREQGDEIARLAVELDDPGAEMLARWMLGCIAFWRGEFIAADRELAEAIKRYDPEHQQANTLALQIDPGVNAMCHRCWGQWILGFADQALETGDRAVRAARELAQPFALAMALFFASETNRCCGRHAVADRLVEELLTVTAEHALGYLATCARVLKGETLIVKGEHAAGIGEILAALSELKETESGLGAPWTLSILATGYARLGRIGDGLKTLDRAIAAVAESGEHHWEAELNRLRGELLLAGPTADDIEAEKYFRAALTVARRQAAKSLELRASLSLSRLLELQGKTDSARALISEVVGSFTEGFDSADVREATAAAKHGHAALRKHVGANTLEGGWQT